MEHRHVCPWWIGYLLASPVRRLMEDPYKILKPFINPGMKVVDFGPGMGFFSIPAARLTGNNGSVLCIDIQSRMLMELEKRAVKKGLSHIISTSLIEEETDICEADSKDLIIAYAVIHELPDPVSQIALFYKWLKKGGRVLFTEPKGHVSTEDFAKSLDLFTKAGFTIESQPDSRKGRSAVLIK